MMNDIRLTTPFTLESLEQQAPEAFKELAKMESEPRTVMFTLLNGGTTAPIGYGIADHEFVKEDSIISELRTKYFVDIETEKVQKNQCVHLMSDGLIFEFLIDRDTMRRRVRAEVLANKEKRSKKAVLDAEQLYGFDWVITILNGGDPSAAANDSTMKNDSE